MERTVYDTVEDLLSPQALASIQGGEVRGVRREPFASVDGLSGGKLWWVDVEGISSSRYVLKRFSWDSDWVMRVTEDRQARAIVSWKTGLLDRLPDDFAHEVVGCARDGSGWAILLHDASAAMIPPGDELIAPEDNERFVDAMASMHSTFWEQPQAADGSLGFCTLYQRYSALAPRVVGKEASGDDAIPPVAVEGWRLLPDLVDGDVSDAVTNLLGDPGPLCDALLRYPQTVVHGDFKLGNLGIHRSDGRVVLLDWALVGSAPPAVDLAWYLAVNCARLPVSKEATIERYRESLARRLGPKFDVGWWRPQLDLALLGGFVQLGWPKAWGAVRGDSEETRARERAELAWWSDRVREGVRWL
jgi:hypothetical protein